MVQRPFYTDGDCETGINIYGVTQYGIGARLYFGSR